MTVEDDIKADIIKMLQRDYRIEGVKEVVSYDEEWISTGFCETCWDEEATVHIVFINAEGEEDDIHILGYFTDFIYDLTHSYDEDDDYAEDLLEEEQ